MTSHDRIIHYNRWKSIIKAFPNRYRITGERFGGAYRASLQEKLPPVKYGNDYFITTWLEDGSNTYHLYKEESFYAVEILPLWNIEGI